MNEMQKTEMQKAVEELIQKAAKATLPDEAMKFAQAALNASNAMCGLNSLATK